MTDSHLVTITLTGAQLEKLLQLEPAYIGKLITPHFTLLKLLQAALNTLDLSRVVRGYVFAKGIFDWSRHLIQQALAIVHCLLCYSFWKKTIYFLRNVCLVVSVLQLKPPKFTWCWMGQQYAQPFPHTCTCHTIHVQCYLPLWRLHPDFGHFNNGLCHVMKITTAESNLDMGLVVHETFRFKPEHSGQRWFSASTDNVNSLWSELICNNNPKNYSYSFFQQWGVVKKLEGLVG